MSTEPMQVNEASAGYLAAAEGQDVPAGYKRTELGEIPKDWAVREIGELEPYVTSGSRGWAGYYADRGDAFLRIGNLSHDSIYVDLSDLRLVSLPKNDAEGLRTQLRDGDLLISITADIGIIGYVDPSVPKPAYINQHIALVRFDPAKVDTKFLSYFLASEHAQRIFRSTTDQGAKAGLNLDGVRKIKSAFPPISEQHAIAETLSNADGLIAALDKLIAKKRAIKQAAMQQLLTGKARLPGFSGEWETKRLGDVAEVVMGQSPVGSSYNRDGNGVPLINGPTEFTDKYPVKIQWTSEPTKLCQKGDLLLCVRGSSTGRTNISDDKYCIGRGVAAIRAKSQADTSYITYQVRSAIQVILAATTGSTFPNIDGKSIRAIYIPFPQLNEQVAIAAVLSDMDAEIAALEARRDKTKQIKQGMMQQLLTGRIRLPALLNENER